MIDAPLIAAALKISVTEMPHATLARQPISASLSNPNMVAFEDLFDFDERQFSAKIQDENVHTTQGLKSREATKFRQQI